MASTHSWFLLSTRIGFAARGVLYLLVAYLALQFGRAEDLDGALRYLNSGAGRGVLAVMALGFFAYGLWRLADAAFDTDGHGRGAKGAAIRLAHAASGFIHLWLGWETSELVFGNRSGAEGQEAAEAGAATAMSLPAGGLLLLAGAALLLAVGAYQIAHAARQGFLRTLAPEAQRKAWVRLAGMVGYGARGAAFVLAAWLLFRAWKASSAAAAGGLGDILASLPDPMSAALAIGLAAFATFSLVEARYRALRDPRIAERVADIVPQR